MLVRAVAAVGLAVTPPGRGDALAVAAALPLVPHAGHHPSCAILNTHGDNRRHSTLSTIVDQGDCCLHPLSYTLPPLTIHCVNHSIAVQSSPVDVCIHNKVHDAISTKSCPKSKKGQEEVMVSTFSSQPSLQSSSPSQSHSLCTHSWLLGQRSEGQCGGLEQPHSSEWSRQSGWPSQRRRSDKHWPLAQR